VRAASAGGDEALDFALAGEAADLVLRKDELAVTDDAN